MELFKIGFVSVSIIDLIDVTLIAIFLYVVYRSLRDTVAVQVLILLAILLGLGFATEAANLKTMNWILRRIADVGLIAFVVLFQPELRRVLLLLTQSRIFRVFVRTSNSDTIDDVVDAVTEMSTKHVGALVVFSRAEHLRVTVETGISLQAEVSSDLLLSIFNPRSPLHDGAVVIDGRTVTAARCVLPLSHEQRIRGRNLGTRHRAGLGITEQADAVAVIVSEETGSISIAFQGELTMNVTHDDLKKTLLSNIEELGSS